MDKKELITIRDAVVTDAPFIYRRVLMGTYHGNRPGKGKRPGPYCPIDFFSSINQDTFMKSYHSYLEGLFSRLGVKIRIACLKEDSDVILGFSIYNGDVLHYVFVKPDWRGIGLGNDLIPKDIKTVTGFTRVGDIIRRKKGWEFNPWL